MVLPKETLKSWHLLFIEKLCSALCLQTIGNRCLLYWCLACNFGSSTSKSRGLSDQVRFCKHSTKYMATGCCLMLSSNCSRIHRLLVKSEFQIATSRTICGTCKSPLPSPAHTSPQPEMFAGESVYFPQKVHLDAGFQESTSTSTTMCTQLRKMAQKMKEKACRLQFLRVRGAV